mmetsp:Transcript_93664/g.269704  ORF Transcript_93664/g.269704 Transcript_93664/m.269704 type:complete len:389 (+) Transcript_93664:1415-2581(+)
MSAAWEASKLSRRSAISTSIAWYKWNDRQGSFCTFFKAGREFEYHAGFALGVPGSACPFTPSARCNAFEAFLKPQASIFAFGCSLRSVDFCDSGFCSLPLVPLSSLSESRWRLTKSRRHGSHFSSSQEKTANATFRPCSSASVFVNKSWSGAFSHCKVSGWTRMMTGDFMQSFFALNSLPKVLQSLHVKRKSANLGREPLPSINVSTSVTTDSTNCMSDVLFGWTKNTTRGSGPSRKTWLLSGVISCTILWEPTHLTICSASSSSFGFPKTLGAAEEPSPRTQISLGCPADSSAGGPKTWSQVSADTMPKMHVPINDFAAWLKAFEALLPSGKPQPTTEGPGFSKTSRKAGAPSSLLPLRDTCMRSRNFTICGALTTPLYSNCACPSR